MNLNGKSIFSISYFYKINLKNILIIHDELDLVPGTIKLKKGIGHNGHNGLRNIIETFKKKNLQHFYRIRIGIGRPINRALISNFVLSIPDKKECLLINNSIQNSIQNIYNSITDN